MLLVLPIRSSNVTPLKQIVHALTGFYIFDACRMDDVTFYISESSGILPGYLYKSKPKIYKILSFLHTIFTLCVTFYPASQFAMIIGELEDPPTKIFYILVFVQYTLQSILCTTPVLYHNILYPNAYIKMKQNFKRIDLLLKKRALLSKQNKWIIFKFIIFHTCYFTINYVYTDGGWNRYSNIYNVLVLWPMYVWYIQIPIAWTILEAVRERLYILNKYINQIYPIKMEFIKVTNTKSITTFDNQYPCDIVELLEIYDKLTKIIKTFNKLFGMFSSLLAFIVIIEYVSNVFRIVTFEEDPDIETAIIDVFTMIMHTVSILLVRKHIVNVYLYIPINVLESMAFTGDKNSTSCGT